MPKPSNIITETSNYALSHKMPNLPIGLVDWHRIDPGTPDAVFPESLDEPEQISGLGFCGEIDTQFWNKTRGHNLISSYLLAHY